MNWRNVCNFEIFIKHCDFKLHNFDFTFFEISILSSKTLGQVLHIPKVSFLLYNN